MPGRARDHPAARTSLAVRVTLLVIAVAVLVAVIASVVGVLVVRRTLIDVTTQALSDRADVILAQVGRGARRTPIRHWSATAAVLAEQGIEVVLIGPGGKLTRRRPPTGSGRPPGRCRAGGRRCGRSPARRLSVGNCNWSRPDRPANRGFALVAPADVAAATRQALERRLLWAILGGVVAAVLVGLLVARVVSDATAPNCRAGPRDGSGGARPAGPGCRTAGGGRGRRRGQRTGRCLAAQRVPPTSVPHVGVPRTADAVGRDHRAGPGIGRRDGAAGRTGRGGQEHQGRGRPPRAVGVGSARSCPARCGQLPPRPRALRPLGVAGRDGPGLANPLRSKGCRPRRAAARVRRSWSTPMPGGSVRCWTGWPRTPCGCSHPADRSCCMSASRLVGRPAGPGRRSWAGAGGLPGGVRAGRPARALPRPAGRAGQVWGSRWRTAWWAGWAGRSWRRPPSRAELR